MGKNVMIVALAGLLVAGCANERAVNQSDPSSEMYDFGGKTLYLRGEMNDWQVREENQVVKVAPRLYMATGTLTKGKGLYRFKIADSDWSCGTHFGYQSLCNSMLVAGGKAVTANSCVTESALTISVESAGAYEFYLDISGELPQVYVKKI